MESKDALPDPPRKGAGRCKMKTVVCIVLLLICFSSSLAAICAPGDNLPDPRNHGDNLPDPSEWSDSLLDSGSISELVFNGNTNS